MVYRFDDSNAEKFKKLIDPELYADMKRTFYRGIASTDDGGGVNGTLILELKNIERERDNAGRILQIRVKDPEAVSTLMKEYKVLAKEELVKRSFYEFPEKKDAVILVDSGFSMEEGEGPDRIVRISDLEGLSVVNKIKTPENIGSISALENRDFRKGILNCLFHNRKGLLEDLAYLPMDWYEKEISSYTMLDDKVVGLLLIHKSVYDMLQVKLLFASGPDSQKNLLRMIVHSIKTAGELYPPDTKVTIRCESDAAAALAANLFPNVRGMNAVWGDRKEITVDFD